jgi:hypothetical protein
MEAQEAINLVNHRLSFWKGWTFAALPYEGTTILIATEIDTVDTSYPSSDGVCRSTPITLHDAFTVDVSGLDEQGLCHRVIEFVADTHEHEDREALKVRQPDGTWVAPLHPHTVKGESGWQRCQIEGALSGLLSHAGGVS